MGLARIVLAKDRAEELAEGIVECVQPDHRRRAKMTVVVPGPARRENEIAGMHRDALALDRGVGAFALDDEPQRIRRVPVRGSDLAGLDHLMLGPRERLHIVGIIFVDDLCILLVRTMVEKGADLHAIGQLLHAAHVIAMVMGDQNIVELLHFRRFRGLKNHGKYRNG